MPSSPMQIVKERFGDKAKLVAAVEKLTTDELWLDRVNPDKGLDKVSNAKLLRLHDTLTAVKDKFGSRAKLIDAILELEQRSGDAGYKSRLEGYPTPRLMDAYKTAEHRKQAGPSRRQRKAITAKTKPRSKKARAKAASA